MVKQVSEIEIISNTTSHEKQYSFGEFIKEKQEDIESSNVSEEELDPDVEELPLIVREIVPLEDDPSIPVFTFRYFILAIIFIIPGAFIDTMNSYRTTSAAYSIFFVQIASHWAGKWLAKVLPNKEVRIFGRFKFNLNPGPWSIKETALITITANSGATGNQGTTPLSLSEVYYGTKVNGALAIFYMWAIVFIGYSYSAIARNFLIYDPQFIWPSALMQTTLFQTQKKSDGDSKLGSKQMKVFFIALIGMSVWEFFPEFIFPMLSSLAFLCWVAPRNKTANFIGSGLNGMGFLNLTLDWSNITSSIMLSPYWIQVIQFIAFVFGAWILLPAAKWGNLTDFKYGLMSNGLFLSNGTAYPTNKLLTNDLRLNQTALAELGPVHMGAQTAWNMFFAYASYISGVVWVCLFGYESMGNSIKKLYASFRARKTSDKTLALSINEQYTDRLNKLQSKYNEVPQLWFLILFAASFITLLVIFATGRLFMPWWCMIVGIAFGALIVTPLSWLYALSNFQLAIGSFDELLYGYMVQNRTDKHPVGATIYGAIAGDAWYRAQYILQDQKIGHYMHLPPKAVFFSQIFGALVGIPINYAAMRWVLNTKMDFLNGTKIDPLHQWTGQSLKSYNTKAVQYVILGPKILFENYSILPYGFVLGVGAPIVFYILHRLFPNSRLKFRLWNTTVFFSTMENFYGNLSTGYFSQFIGGTVAMFWAYRYKHELWKRYNYLLAAAFDTGYNLTVLLIFIIFSSGRVINMPNWWGNNEESVERCFALVD
ncbi:oligopeptide transporter protein [Scheffersomyces amazonensis]|uniref:oligopeptide transporter protein n=1 Tax=Scheffersomyces amazonensis TaxID=1078765 RepID=UPI00315DE347